MSSKRTSWILFSVGSTLILITAYAWLFLQHPIGQPGAYNIDISAMRALAKKNPTQLPTQIESLVIAEGEFPAAAILAGWSLFEKHRMTFASYRLIYNNHSLIIDTAHDHTTHSDNYPDQPFYNDNYSKMQTELTSAANNNGQILLTHEHPDHIGGILKSENLEAVSKITTISNEQIEGASQFANQEQLQYFSPINYSGIISPAPGVVIQKAAGHSPGSQIVYIVLQDGREFLFIGDIAWDYASIKTGISRPLIVSLLFLHENRQSVANQLITLQKLAESEPNLHIVVAHDANQLEELRLKNIIVEGFHD